MEREKIGVDIWIAGTIYVDAANHDDAKQIVVGRYGSIGATDALEINDDWPLTDDPDGDFLSAAMTVYGPCEFATLAAVDPVRDATPDMLAVLKDCAEILFHLGTAGKTQRQDEAIDAVRERALSAIAKAEGRA